jgi:hypothetical protein
MQSAPAACVCKLPGTSAFTYMHSVLTLCFFVTRINPLNTELNPICYLLALLGAHHFLHVSRIRVNVDTKRHTRKLTFMQLLEMLFDLKSYLYTLLFMIPISPPPPN